MMTVQVSVANGTHEALINQHLIIKVMNAGVSLGDELILPTFHFVPDILQKLRRVDSSRKSRRFIGTSSPHPKRNRDQSILPLDSLNLVSFSNSLLHAPHHQLQSCENLIRDFFLNIYNNCSRGTFCELQFISITWFIFARVLSRRSLF
jgi:hypothetical protein